MIFFILHELFHLKVSDFFIFNGIDFLYNGDVYFELSLGNNDGFAKSLGPTCCLSSNQKLFFLKLVLSLSLMKESPSMEKSERNPKMDILLWSSLGPVLLLLTSAVLLLKPLNAQSSLILMTGMGGLILCGKWHYQGLVASLGLILCVFYLMRLHSLDDLGWHLGIMTALILTWIAATLAYEEVELISQNYNDQSLFQKKQIDELTFSFSENSRLQEDQIKDLAFDKEALQAQIQEKDLAITALHQQTKTFELRMAESQHKNEELASQYVDQRQQTTHLQKQLELHLAEISFLKKQYDNLQQELTAVTEESHTKIHHQQEILEKAKQCCDRLNHEKTDLEDKIARHQREKEIAFQESAAQVRELAEVSSQLQLVRISLVNQEELLKVEISQSKRLKEESLQREAQLNHEIATLREKVAYLQSEIEQGYTEVKRLSDLLSTTKQERQKLIDTLKENNQSNDHMKALNLAQAMYKQLQHQFEEKSLVLDATRKELFFAQEQILVFKKQNEEHKLFSLDFLQEKLVRQFCRMEKEFMRAEKAAQEEMELMIDLITNLYRERAHASL